MEAAARLTSKGQVTIPKSVRSALGLREGDTVIFHVDGARAVIGPTANLLDLAGSVSVPVAKRGVSWEEVQRSTREARAKSRR